MGWTLARIEGIARIGNGIHIAPEKLGHGRLDKEFWLHKDGHESVLVWAYSNTDLHISCQGLVKAK